MAQCQSGLLLLQALASKKPPELLSLVQAQIYGGSNGIKVNVILLLAGTWDMGSGAVGHVA